MSTAKFLAVSCCLALVAATQLHATAGGPDHLMVTGVAEGDVLNMRMAPSTDATVIEGIPADTDGLLSFGCIGGLSLSEWQTASETERAASLKARWCLVAYDGVIGWSAGWFLNEGSFQDTTDAATRLNELAGSAWRLRETAGDPAQAEAWIQFDLDGRAFGSSGCNRFTGSYETMPERLSFGPLAMTRRACPGPESDTEAAFMLALGRTYRIAATNRVLSLFDEENVLLATLTRRPAD